MTISLSPQTAHDWETGFESHTSSQSESSMDHETAILIAQLQLEDSLQLCSALKGKARADAEPPDNEIALRLQMEELTTWKQLHQDANLAQSVDKALSTDAALLEALCVVEETAFADRRSAELLMQGARTLPAPNAAQIRVGEDRNLFNFDAVGPNDVNASSADQVVSDPKLGVLDKSAASQPCSQSIAPTTKKRLGRLEDRASTSVNRNTSKVVCISCNDRFAADNALKAQCEHYYCEPCLADLIQVYIRDEALHPLRCCSRLFHVPDVLTHLKDPTLLASFHSKQTEYGVPAQHRVYCSTPTCSSFLGSAEDHKIRADSALLKTSDYSVTCEACRAQTCANCRKPAHGHGSSTSGSSPQCSVENEMIAQVRVLAKEQGWQTCPQCSTVIELHHGCNHMTCRCRAQFCYECGIEWKNCACAGWIEDRLLDTAQRRAENAMGRDARVEQPQALAQTVRRMVETIRVNHGCDPHSWREMGGGDCEECGRFMPYFLKYCRWCDLQVCKRCKLNRV